MTFGELKERCVMLERQNSEWQRHTKELEAKLAEVERERDEYRLQTREADTTSIGLGEERDGWKARVEALRKALDRVTACEEHRPCGLCREVVRAALAAGRES